MSTAARVLAPPAPDELGEVLVPGDPAYDDAARTFFAAGTPDVVLRPRDVAQVQAAVQYAVAAGLEISVRSGGHSGAGLSTHTSGAVIDLAHLDGIDVDPARRLVRVGVGATWGAVADTLQEYDLGISSGDTRSVGVGGLALGGGIGWMVREHGLTIDAIVAAQVVTADGAVHEIDETHEPDLFWAVRGGGGNVGVVTRLDLIAQPVAGVQFGTITYAVADVPWLITRWRDVMRAADRRLSSTLVLMPGMMGNAPSVLLTVCFADDDEAGADAAIEPLLGIGEVLRCDLAQLPYAQVLADEQGLPPGLRMVVRNALPSELTDDLVWAIDKAWTDRDVMVALRSLGGAVADVAPDATAFAHRDAEVMLQIGGVVPPGAPDPLASRWPAVAAQAEGGAYAGFLSTADADDVAAVFPEPTRRRLAHTKAEYDPANVFHRNHNVPPATHEEA
ncbi:FAD-binding oxidoreductase [Luteipulveratus halotolerans]|uniref:FAD-binding PCMH-type domain-containing protein n=1 Tax=Luteipulveratus halotolerans TaxID=1631356 RepID=A0A0L6CP32_9MICO|nr:FAD-binding protein [Luteipulveratus halotolerans]KNX39420.1 hypothetical protein VV01_11930 [Luteipulveratus halotolerans]